MTMARQWWDEPVIVATRVTGQSVTINSTERAAEFILNEWPAKEEGEALHAAKVALIDAYEGRISLDDARRAFIAAIEEANIPIIPNARPPNPPARQSRKRPR
jgi:hypothetical protein